MKTLTDVSEEALIQGVREMCRTLGITGSLLGSYDLYHAVLLERRKAQEHKRWWDGRRKHWKDLDLSA